MTTDIDTSGNISIMEIPQPLAETISMCLEINLHNMYTPHQESIRQLIYQLKSTIPALPMD